MPKLRVQCFGISLDGFSPTSAVVAEAVEIVTTLSRPFQGRQVEEALFAMQR